MQKVQQFVDDTGQLHDVAEDGMGNFQSAMQQQGRSYQPTTLYMGEDEGDIFHVPQNEQGRFEATMEKQGEKYQRVRTILTVDEQKHRVAEDGVGKFTQAYRTAPEFQADREALHAGIQKQSEEATAAGERQQTEQTQRMAGESKQRLQAEYAGRPVAGVTRDIGAGVWDALANEWPKGVMKTVQMIAPKGSKLEAGAKGSARTIEERQAGGQGVAATSDFAMGVGQTAGSVLPFAAGAVGLLPMVTGAVGNAQGTFENLKARGKSDKEAREWAVAQFAVQTIPMIVAQRMGMGPEAKKMSDQIIQKMTPADKIKLGKAMWMQFARETGAFGAAGAVSGAGSAALQRASGENPDAEPLKQALVGGLGGMVGAGMFAGPRAMEMRRIGRMGADEEAIQRAIQEGRLATAKAGEIGNGQNGLNGPAMQEQAEASAKAFEAAGVAYNQQVVDSVVNDIKARKQAAAANREPVPNRAERRAAVEQGLAGPEEADLTNPDDPKNLEEISRYIQAVEGVPAGDAAAKAAGMSTGARAGILKAFRERGAMPDIERGERVPQKKEITGPAETGNGLETAKPVTMNLATSDEQLADEVMKTFQATYRASRGVAMRRHGLGREQTERVMDILEARGWIGPQRAGEETREILKKGEETGQGENPEVRSQETEGEEAQGVKLDLNKPMAGEAKAAPKNLTALFGDQYKRQEPEKVEQPVTPTAEEKAKVEDQHLAEVLGMEEGRERTDITDRTEKKGKAKPKTETTAGGVKVETDAKGQKTVSVPAKDKPGIDLKEQKRYMLAELDKAIEAAPIVGKVDPKILAAWKEEHGDNFGKWFDEHSANADKAGRVTIEIPGDGQFTLFEDKGALTAFRERAQRQFPTTVPRPDMPRRGGGTESRFARQQAVDSLSDGGIRVYGDAAKAIDEYEAYIKSLKGTGAASQYERELHADAVKELRMRIAQDEEKAQGPKDNGPDGQIPEDNGQPGEVHGEGGSMRARRASREEMDVEEAEVPAELRKQVIDAGAAVLKGRQKPGIIRWFEKKFAANMLDETGRWWANILQGHFGEAMRLRTIADDALKAYRDFYDRTRTAEMSRWIYDPAKPLPRSIEVMKAIDTGDMEALSETDRKFAATMRVLLDDAIKRVQEVSPTALRELYEDYFPRAWKAGKAMTPEQAQRLARSLVGGNGEMGRRPFEGPKSFMKQRSLELWDDALKAGLVPVSDNPAEMALNKLAEMYRFVAAEKSLQEGKAAGLVKFRSVFAKPRDGWKSVKDVFGPPELKAHEYVDFHLFDAGVKWLAHMGVPHERLTDLGKKSGMELWGYAERGGKVATKFGGDMGVLWHEIAHQLDYRYNFFDELVRNAIGVGKKGEPTLGASQKQRGLMDREMRALADLRSPGGDPAGQYRKYLHEEAEKSANLVEAFVRSPEEFRRVAPNLYKAMNDFVDLHPELKGLREIHPGVARTTLENTYRLNGLPLLGHWEMPEGAAQVHENWLSKNRLGELRGLQGIAGLENQAQLLGFFHGQMVWNDSMASGVGFLINDILAGRLGRVPGDLLHIPTLPFEALYRGHLLGKEYVRAGSSGDPQIQAIAKALEQSNMRTSGVDHQDFMREFKRAAALAWNTGSMHAGVEAMLKAPMAAAQTAMWPVMRYLVPNMKRGMFALEMKRWMEANPNATPEELRRAAQIAAANTENRLGQVTYENLHQNATIKAGMQMGLRAYGWQLTKYRGAAGAISDWAKAGKAMATGQKVNITERMTYLPALVITHAVMGAMLQRALTGKWPQETKDYLFPESGLVDQYGNPVRIAMADFLKDFVADFRSFPNPKKMTEDWTRKLSPMWNMAAEMYRDKDFYGDEIFSAREIDEPYEAHFRKNLAEAAHYLATKSEPFSVRGGAKMRDEYGAGPMLSLAPYVGLVPAPAYASKTPAEIRAAEIMQANRPTAARTAPEKERADELRRVQGVMREALRTGEISKAGNETLAHDLQAVRSHADMAKIMQKIGMTPLQYQVMHMPNARDAMEVWDLADQKQKAQILGNVVRKVYRDKGLAEATREKYIEIIRRTAPAGSV